jgi:predicted permease
MTGSRSGLPPLTGERVFRLLLRLYPAEFRRELGEEMVEFYRDRVRDEWGRRGWLGIASLWGRAAADLLSTGVAERVSAMVRRRGATRHAPPACQSTSDPRTGEMLWSIMQDVRFAARGIIKRPAFSAVVLATLTLGIGANAAIFSVVNGVLLHPLPYRDVGRIVHIQHEDPYWTVSEPEFKDYKTDVRSLDRVAAWAPTQATLTGSGEPERINVIRVSDGFFDILGTPARLGRTFTPQEDTRGTNPVVILSDGLWRRRYGADPQIIGKTIELSARRLTVVGVMPPPFAFPQSDVALWVPLRLDYDSLWTRNNHYLRLLGRAGPTHTPAGVGAELNTLARAFVRDYPDIYGIAPLRVTVTPISDQLLGRTRPYLLALLGAVGFVLLIACVNVANLLLARGESRRKELAIRTALGATRRRLVRQVLTESLIYAACGGIAGTVAAWWGVRLLVAAAPSTIPRLDEVTIDGTVLAFTVALSLVTGLIFGLVPALRGSHGDSAETLKEGGKTAGQARGVHRARGALVVAEVALAVVMLTGAGLMVRSLLKLQAIDLGFDARHVLAMDLALPQREYTPERAVEYFRAVLERIRGIPGVESAAAVGDLPIADPNSNWSINLDGRELKNIGDAPAAMPQQVTPQYFRVMGIPVVRGRVFTEQDRAGAPPVVVINEAMAKEHWPGTDPLGHTLKMFNPQSPWVTIVGVVKDVRSSGFEERVPPTMYFPHAQAGESAYYTPLSMDLVIRTAGDPTASAGAIREAVRGLDRNVPISRVQSMERIVATSIASRRFSTTMLVTFAAVALALAGIGIYGVISYAVSQRTFEIGLRMALGAQRMEVLRLMMAHGMRMAVLGLAIGLAGALAITRLLASLLVGVTTMDPVTFAVVIAVLLAVALLACYVPARRATTVDPMEALRTE